MENPVYPNTALGLRRWRLGWDGLYSDFGQMHWTSRTAHAECLKDSQHHAPVHQCTCGLYAWHDDTVREFAGRWRINCPDKVWGLVAARGQTEVHGTGFRAEELCIIGFWFSDKLGRDDPDYEFPRYSGHISSPRKPMTREGAEQVLRSFRVPLLTTLEDLIASGADYQYEYCPKELRPKVMPSRVTYPTND